MEVVIGQPGHTAAPGRPGQKADLHQVRLINILQRHALLPHGGGQGIQPHRTSGIVLNDGGEDAAVDAVQAEVIHLQPFQRLGGDLRGDDPAALHLGKVPDPLQKAVGDAGGAAAAAGQLHGSLGLTGDAEDPGRPGDDLGKLLRGVQLQPEHHAEAVPQGGGKLPGPGGGSHQGKMGQVDADGTGAGPLADDDIEGVVLHGGVQYLLHAAVQPVDLIDEEDIIFIEVGQQGSQIARFFDGRTAGNTDIDPHFRRDDLRKGGFAQAGGAVKQHMVQRLPAQARRLHKDREIFLDLLLPDVFLQRVRAQGKLIIPVVFGHLRGDKAVFQVHLVFRLFASIEHGVISSLWE